MHTLALTHPTGGIGKTHIAVELAVGLSRMRQRCLLIDLDPQAGTTLGLGVDPQRAHSLFEVFSGQTGIDSLITATHIDHLDFIPADIMLAASDRMLRTPPLASGGLEAHLRPLRQHYDHVIIDCPARLGPLTQTALTAADLLLIPVQATLATLHGLQRLHDVLNLTPMPTGVRPSIMAVPYHFDRHATLGRKLLALIEAQPDMCVSPVCLWPDRKFPDSVSDVQSHRPESRKTGIHQDFEHLAQGIQEYLKSRQAMSATRSGQPGHNGEWNSVQRL